MSAYGFEIVQTLIVDIEPDVQVKRAMNDINAGNSEHTRMILTATSTYVVLSPESDVRIWIACVS